MGRRTLATTATIAVTAATATATAGGAPARDAQHKPQRLRPPAGAVKPASLVSVADLKAHKLKTNKRVLRFSRRGVAVLDYDLGAAGQAAARGQLYLYSLRDRPSGLFVRRAGTRGPRVKSGPLHRHRWVRVRIGRLLAGSAQLQLVIGTHARQGVLLAGRGTKHPPKLSVQPGGAQPNVAPPPAAAPAPDAPASTPPPTVTPPSSSRPCGTTSLPPSGGWQHVVWIVMENKRYEQIVGSSTAPFINGLISKCGLATNFYAEAHPSLPNYIAMTSGSTQGISDDSGPSSHRLNVPSIFSQLGSGWRSLEETMSSNCAQGDSGLYAVRHNPAAYYTNISSQCAAQDVPLTDPPDLSAKFTFVTPNSCDDMHSCPSGNDSTSQITNGDRWLSQWMPKILDSPQYEAGNTVVFITWDEDDYSSNQHVATLVLAPSVSPGSTSGTSFTHYSMLRTTEEIFGLPPLGSAASASSMRADFHL